MEALGGNWREKKPDFALCSHLNQVYVSDPCTKCSSLRFKLLFQTAPRHEESSNGFSSHRSKGSSNSGSVLAEYQNHLGIFESSSCLSPSRAVHLTLGWDPGAIHAHGNPQLIPVQPGELPAHRFIFSLPLSHSISGGSFSS